MTAIVAGGSGQLGTRVAQRLLDRGEQVLVLDRVAPSLAHSSLHHIEIDLTDEAAMTKVRAGCPVPSVLVNCQGWSPKDEAGVAVAEDVLSAHDFMAVVESNLLSCFLILREFVPAMARSVGGHVVNVSSTSARTGRSPASIAYSAAKAGVDALTKRFAVRYAASNVIVCGVAPGKLANSRWPATTDVIDAYRDETPLGRLVGHDDVADLIVFLASERNAHLTGQTVIVDGGRLA
ncbi:MAG: hypothetical protein V7607_1696 [Solirubrobacteraceae bacterium]